MEKVAVDYCEKGELHYQRKWKRDPKQFKYVTQE